MITKCRVPDLDTGQTNLLFSIRTLWRDLVTWGKTYLVSRYSGLTYADNVFNRLYLIPKEFGNMLQLIFGYDKSQRFVQLLSQQIILIKSLIDAQMSGDVNLANQLIQQLYKLSDERAAFMNSINPFWDTTQVRNNIYTFLQLTMEDIITFLSADYNRNIDVYDRLLHHADNMGDYFTAGIFYYVTLNQQLPAPPSQTTISSYK